MSKFNKFRFEFNPLESFMVNVPELSNHIQVLSRGRGRLVTDLTNGIIEVYGVTPSKILQLRIRMAPMCYVYELMDTSAFIRKAALASYGLK